MSKRGGTICAVKECPSSTAGKDISLFRFPKDPQRPVLWLEACDRGDLASKSSAELYNNFKLCARHFEAKMYTNMYQNRLLPTALPTIFPQLPSLKRKIFDISPEQPPCKKIQICSEIRGPTNWEVTCDAGSSKSSPLRSLASTQTHQWLSSGTPRKTKLRQKLKESRRELEKMKRMLNPKENKPSLAELHKICDEYLPKPLAKFVKIQARFSRTKPKGRRYTMEYKRFALTLYFLGPRAYKFLKKLFYLSSKRSLERMTEKLVFQPGINNEALFKCLEMKIDSMRIEEKHCIICIDEMSIKSNFFYHIGRDEIVGLQDMGGENKYFKPACNATVIMARGLYANWKQPLAYFFVESTFPAKELKDTLCAYVKKLSEVGLKIDAVVTDMGSNFTELGKLLGVTPDSPQFKMGDQEIIYLFDTPHLLKATRNNLLKNHLQFKKSETTFSSKTEWSFILNFYEKDKLLPNRSAPKLTHSHLYPTNFEKMKVKFATQVLSYSVASAMNTYISLGALPSAAMATVDVISKFNHLFDILNSSYGGESHTVYQKVFSAEKYQIDFLKEMYDFINSLRVYNKNGEDITNKVRFKNSWLITINGIPKLWHKLKDAGFKYLITRRVNQDCLENFFGSVRQQGGNCVNPTPIQFERTFKKLFCQDYLSSENANCADDFDNLLTQLKDLKYKVVEDRDVQQQQTISIIIPDCDYRTEDLPAQNAFVYVCGYLIKKTLTVHECSVCKELGNFTKELSSHTLLSYFKAYDNESSLYGALHVPHENFLQYIYELEKIFFSNFNEYCLKKRVAYNYFQLMKDIYFFHPCPHFPKEYLLKLFIRLRIFYALKFANRELKTKTANKKNRKIFILSHL